MTTEPTRHSPASLDQLLRPMLVLQGTDAETQMGATIGEALVLPGADNISITARHSDSILPVLVDSYEWIQKVVRPKWLVPDFFERLYAVPNGVNGQDSIIGAWEVGDRVVQIVVTRERIHLLTRSQKPQEEDGGQNPYKLALLLARDMLLIEEEIDPVPWQFRSFGGLSLGYQDHAVTKDWQQSLLVLTDGSAFKFSARKVANGDSLEKESLLPSHDAWFPQ